MISEGDRSGTSSVDGNPQSEGHSQLAGIKQGLQKLAEEGAVYYGGEVVSSKHGNSKLFPHEKVVLYLGLTEHPPLETGVIDASRSLANKLDIRNGLLSGNSEFALLEIPELLARRTIKDEIKVDDISPSMQAVIESAHTAAFGLLRYIEVRVFKDKETADAARRLDTGEIDQRGLRRERRKIHPIRTKIFNALDPRTHPRGLR